MLIVVGYEKKLVLKKPWHIRRRWANIPIYKDIGKGGSKDREWFTTSRSTFASEST